MARYAGVTQWQVRKVWQAADVKPHRLKTFKLSRDPQFVEKVIDVVGLYLNPPDNALVLSVDEKTQIQALDRTHPMLPLRPGQVGRRTHDYKRHGTSNLHAAFNVATGEVLGRITRRHRATEFRQFLAANRPGDAARAGVTPDRRQQQHPHDRSDTRLPRCPSPLSPALHADQRVMAQCCRDLVRPVGAACPQARRLHQRERTAGGNPPLHRGSQHALCQTVPMDQVGPRYPRCCRTGAPIIASRNLPHGTLVAPRVPRCYAKEPEDIRRRWGSGVRHGNIRTCLCIDTRFDAALTPWNTLNSEQALNWVNRLV